MRERKNNSADSGSGIDQAQTERCDRLSSIEESVQRLVERVTELEAHIASSKSSKRARKETNIPATSQSSLVWSSYREAYFSRYKVEPVRNAKVNAQISQLIKRVGPDAETVMTFYITLNDQWLVQHFHPLDALISKCEGFVTRMKTGVEMNRAKAQKVETFSASAQASKKYLERKYNGSS